MHSDESWHCLLYLGPIISSWRCGQVLKSVFFCVLLLLGPLLGISPAHAMECGCVLQHVPVFLMLQLEVGVTFSSCWPLVPHLHLFERPHFCEAAL